MSEEWKHAGWVSGLGTWAWVIALVSGIIDIIIAISGLAVLGAASFFFGVGFGIGYYIWWLISGIIVIIIAVVIIRPKFSKRCSDKDWDGLLNWVIGGNVRFPMMLFWGIMVEIFGYGWGGFAIIIPALVLIFAGPKKFEWKK